MEALSGRELDRALTAAAGFIVCAVAGDCPRRDDPRPPNEYPHWHQIANDDHYWSNQFPAFSESVDALAPVEAKLRAAGMRFDVTNDQPAGVILARWSHPFNPKWTSEIAHIERAETEPLARARAALAALKALASVREEQTS